MLAEILNACNVSQSALARAVGLHPSSVCRLINGRRTLKTAAHLDALRGYLLGLGVTAAQLDAALGRANAPEAPNTEPATTATTEEEDTLMALRHHSLTPQARQTFGIFRNPFDQPERAEDVYLNPAIRYAREALYQAATHGNFLALVGESGSGKSTLRRELIDRLDRDNGDVVVIQPYILNMATRDNGSGKPLRTSHIIEAILHAVNPSQASTGSPERMARRAHEALKVSSRAGNRHVLIIEEAHDLHTQTLKALKRFYELEDGMRRLLSIILIGQPELAQRLSTSAADVREVVQRIDLVTLPPLEDVGEFLRQRCAVNGLDADKLFTADAFAAIKARLLLSRDNRGNAVDMAYPLAVCNVAAACLNEAAACGYKQVDADLATSVRL